MTSHDESSGSPEVARNICCVVAHFQIADLCESLQSQPCGFIYSELNLSTGDHAVGAKKTTPNTPIFILEHPKGRLFAICHAPDMEN